MKLNIRQAAQYGFNFGPHFRDWLSRANMPRIARDAALATVPGAGVPAELAAYIDPMVVDILPRPLKAREIFGEVKKGDWTTPYVKFHTNELTGATEPYSDYGQSRVSGVNYQWLNRENYLFQTVITYGDFEEAVTATARLSLASDKQRAAANTLDVDGNRFALFGVAGREIYGILNDPSLSAPTAPAPSGEGSSPLWSKKTTRQRYDDVLLLFKRLVRQTEGHVDEKCPLTLVMSPDLAVELASATDFNVSVLDMLHKYFTALRIVTLPEMASEATGETMMLIADEVRGMKTGELGYTEKVRAGRLVPDLSSFSQKWTSGTCGALIYLPFAIAQMRGM